MGNLDVSILLTVLVRPHHGENLKRNTHIPRLFSSILFVSINLWSKNDAGGIAFSTQSLGSVALVATQFVRENMSAEKHIWGKCGLNNTVNRNILTLTFIFILSVHEPGICSSLHYWSGELGAQYIL